MIWLFCVAFSFLCCTNIVAAIPSQLKSQLKCDLSNLSNIVHDLLQYYPGTNGIDERVLLQSHEKLFALFDRDKTYLLEQEVTEYLNVKNGRQFFEQFQKKDFNAYCQIFQICRQAIQRSRNVRRGFMYTDTNTLDAIRKSPAVIYEYYASDIDELTARLFHRYLHLIADRLAPEDEGDMNRVRKAVMLAEKELEEHENQWFELSRTLQSSVDSRSIAAQLILKSILSALDSHSDVMGKKGSRTIRERLTKEAFGTGIVATLTKGGCFVQKVVKGSPADLCGNIQERDQILSLDGRLCSEMSISEIDATLNKESEGAVRVALQRPLGRGTQQQSIAVTIPRRWYTMLEGRLEVARKNTPQGTIVILTLHAFYRGGSGISSSEDIKRALCSEKLHGKLAGVILDLRDNGGGYVTEAVRVVGEFIKTGVVLAACYGDGTRLIFRDLEPDILFSGPMVVLTSQATASAAEIVAQALKDYGRAIIVGDPHTYGKGSIQMQTVTDMTENTVWASIPLRLTIGRFYTVSGYSPQSGGVLADICVPGMYERSKAEDEETNSRLKQRLDPMYHDSLDDVRIKARGWYQQHYLPFVQQPTDQYRRWIPILKQKSERRMHQNILWTVLNKNAVSPEERTDMQRQVNALQLNEAIAIEEDLIQLTRGL